MVAKCKARNVEETEEVREEKQAKGAAIISGLACSCDQENGEDHQHH